MTSSRPYLIRAIYEWISDNGLTPYVLVDAEADSVTVPREYVTNGHIVLNISESAVRGLLLGNEFVEFSARFNGEALNIEFPVSAVLGVYARENRQGMFFEENSDDDDTPPPTPKPREQRKVSRRRPALRLVKS